ncbi:polysaccharide deacetylase family protein [Alkalimarinus coralli]|uniref:polysaccharide deacetylase family protein n=1 Tax=Alkalimarinus coralli TaxID=2935863 RepID=UPI00202B7E95|nr:polysaccharide deacetylase family protein [Alkalimarinus coralli]
MKNRVKNIVYRAGVLKILLLVHRMFLKTPFILMYHRLTPDKGSSISVANFEQHLLFLKDNCELVSLADAISHRNNATRGKLKVAITFDDGYDDFYHLAWPLLKKYNVPATLFITTGFIDKVVWLWPDKIDYILNNASCFSAELEGFGVLEFTKDTVSEAWHQLGDYCLVKPWEQRDKLISQLAEQLEVDIPSLPVEGYQGLTWSQLKEMATEGLDIESHTVTHPILSMLKPDELKQELSVSKQVIEENINKKVNVICYPNGFARDISPLVEELAKSCGYQYGVMACLDKHSSVNPYRIGRKSAVKDISSLAFGLLRTPT